MKIDSFKEPFDFLSNFYPAEVKLGEDLYPTVEHAYQAAKTTDPLEQEKIRLAPTPGKAKRLGRKVVVRPDWDDIKIDVMYDLVKQKFQHPDLKELLLATDDAKLIEGNNWGDTFWGVCNGRGENNLGKILMKVRDEVKNQDV